MLKWRQRPRRREIRRRRRVVGKSAECPIQEYLIHDRAAVALCARTPEGLLWRLRVKGGEVLYYGPTTARLLAAPARAPAAATAGRPGSVPVSASAAAS